MRTSNTKKAMECEKPAKQIKLEPPPTQAAVDIVNKAKTYMSTGPSENQTCASANSDELNEWDALDVVTLHIVYSGDDLKEPKRCFKPKLAHQIFGQKEKLFGYISPTIDIYFTANSAKCLLKFAHKGICNRQADKLTIRIFDNLISWLPEDYTTDEDNFLQTISSELHSKMFGNTISEYNLHNAKEKCVRKYIIRECTVSEPGFTDFHARFQCLLVWYIDGANQIDVDDPNWIIIYVYEEAIIENRNETGYYPVGYCAIYKFFHYPNKTRTRISQCFILPSCQRIGIGYKLLSAAYEIIRNIPNIVDITVEDPNPDFQRLRDTVDLHLVRKLESYKFPGISNGYTKKMTDEANLQYKINQRQCRRIYFIIRMGYAMLHNNDEELNNLYSDMETYLVASEPVTLNNATNENIDGNENAASVEPTLSPIIKKLVKEIRPIAKRFLEWLKINQNE